MGKGPEPQPLAPTGPLGAVWFPLGTPIRAGWENGTPGLAPRRSPEPSAHPSGRAPGLAPAVGSAVTPAVSERRIPVAKIWIWF